MFQISYSYSSSSAYPEPGRGGSRLSRATQMSLSPDTSSSSSGESPRRSQASQETQSLQRVLGRPLGPPRWDMPGTPPRRRPGGIRYRCSSQPQTGSSLCEESSGSTPSPPEWPSSSPYL
ncbi:hypothetical protein CRENBAI_012899 [Crenichthys baileyi]|uniref:Uncharacterized protein n=1 Tax=Crenichthys baileyi TaxID=28760 RepID=A0AAV9R4L3_9TELE